MEGKISEIQECIAKWFQIYPFFIVLCDKKPQTSSYAFLIIYFDVFHKIFIHSVLVFIYSPFHM